MAYFAVTYTYADSPAELDEHRPEHRRFLAGLFDKEVLVASGPLLETQPARALLVFRAEGADELRRQLTEDPFQKLGLVANAEITEWNPAVGILAGS